MSTACELVEGLAYIADASHPWCRNELGAAGQQPGGQPGFVTRLEDPPESQRSALVAESDGCLATGQSYCQTCPEYGQASVPAWDLGRQGHATEDLFALGVFWGLGLLLGLLLAFAAA